MYAFISTRKGLIIYQQIKGKWKTDSIHFDGIPVSLTHYDFDRKILWAFLDHGHWGIKIHRSFDLGKNWEPINLPEYPEGAEIVPGKKAFLRYIWASASMPSKSEFDLLIGTDPGGLFGWKETSKSWHLNEALWNRPERQTDWFGAGRDQPGIHSIIVHPDNPNNLFVAVSCAGVYESTDGGKSWEGRNKGLRADFLPNHYADYGHDPHFVAQCQGAPNVLWQQNHCGIFKSDDSAKSWEEVSEKNGIASFGFAVVVHPENPNIAWVAPGISDEIRIAVDKALCICKTEDGGKTWVAKRNGLPQENVFDIVYRHGLSNVGNQLMFGTTTGNAFYSADGGDNWELISNYLPMIYAVEMVGKI